MIKQLHRTVQLILLLCIPAIGFTQDNEKQLAETELTYEHEQLTFSQEVTWELFDSYGNFLKKGTETVIKGESLEDGNYFIKLADTNTAWGFKVHNGYIEGM